MTNVARVWWWYLVHGTPRAASVRAASAAAAKAPGGAALYGLPQHGEARQKERRGASASAAVYLGEEGARAQEEARTRDARRGGRRREGGGAGACSDVLLRLSCGIDAVVWLPTGFATGQADHGARCLHDWTLKSDTACFSMKIERRFMRGVAHIVRPHEVGCAIPTKQLLRSSSSGRLRGRSVTRSNTP